MRTVATMGIVSALFWGRVPEETPRMLAWNRPRALIVQLVHVLVQKLLLLSKELGRALRGSWWDAERRALERGARDACEWATEMVMMVMLAMVVMVMMVMVLWLGRTLRVEGRQGVWDSMVRIRRRALATGRRRRGLAGGRLRV